MSKPKTFSDKCKQESELLTDRFLRVNQAFENLMVLRDFQNNENDLINLSVSFYNGVIETATQSLFIEIYKMFDDSDCAVGIYSLLLRIKKEIRQLNNSVAIKTSVFEKLTDLSAKSVTYSNLQELIDDSLKQIQANDRLIENASKLRDVYYAHSDRSKINNIDKYFKKHKVSFLDIEHLLVLNCNLCNALNSYFYDRITMPLPANYDDFKLTVHYLKLGTEYREKQIFNPNNYNLSNI